MNTTESRSGGTWNDVTSVLSDLTTVRPCQPVGVVSFEHANYYERWRQNPSTLAARSVENENSEALCTRILPEYRWLIKILSVLGPELRELKVNQLQSGPSRREKRRYQPIRRICPKLRVPAWLPVGQFYFSRIGVNIPCWYQKRGLVNCYTAVSTRGRNIAWCMYLWKEGKFRVSCAICSWTLALDAVDWNSKPRFYILFI